MTLPSVIRIFFAIDLPPTAKEKIGNFIGVLKKSSRSHAIRWTRPENLHITLQFLPEVQTMDLPKLMQQVRTNIFPVTELPIKLGGLELFPHAYRPRVIVLNVQNQSILTTLSEQIGQGILATGYPIETRKFRAHLSLGRIKHPHSLKLNFLTEYAKANFDDLVLHDVVLFRSEPQPEGSHYSVIDKILLQSPDE